MRAITERRYPEDRLGERRLPREANTERRYPERTGSLNVCRTPRETYERVTWGPAGYVRRDALRAGGIGYERWALSRRLGELARWLK